VISVEYPVLEIVGLNPISGLKTGDLLGTRGGRI